MKTTTIESTTIEFTGLETRTVNRTYGPDGSCGADFTYIDPDGRRLHTESEELSLSEETCEGHRVEAAVSLPGPASEAAVLLMRALMRAMDLDDKYDLVAKDPQDGA